MATLAPKEWRQAERIFAAALDQPKSRRSDFLKDVCPPDPRIREAVESLLELNASSPDSDRTREPQSAETRKAPDRLLGRYRVIGQIGQGGMSSVYLGERAQGQKVAIKMMAPSTTPSSIRRFHRETRILARLEHANIARFLDCGTTPQGIPFVVLEYVEGVPLTTYCDSCRLGIRQRLQVFLWSARRCSTPTRI